MPKWISLADTPGSDEGAPDLHVAPPVLLAAAAPVAALAPAAEAAPPPVAPAAAPVPPADPAVPPVSVDWPPEASPAVTPMPVALRRAAARSLELRRAPHAVLTSIIASSANATLIERTRAIPFSTLLGPEI